MMFACYYLHIRLFFSIEQKEDTPQVRNSLLGKAPRSSSSITYLVIRLAVLAWIVHPFVYFCSQTDYGITKYRLGQIR